jgi:hypothetical protein
MAKKPNLSDQVVSAAMALAAEKGWRRLALADIAERAKVPLAEVVGDMSTKAAILGAYVKRVDAHMLAGEAEPGVSVRDRLFETIMRRFEAMAPDRRALRVILRESGDDPWALMCGARRFMRTMALTLEAAGISSSGIGGMVRAEALAGIYLYVLNTFLTDDTDDLARTMAVLDKALGRAEGLAALLWRQPRSGEQANPADGEHQSPPHNRKG